jgi:hypothetical protein
MKKIKIIIYILVLLIGVAFAGLYTFVSIKGRDLLISKLHSVFQSEVLVGRVTTSFPLQLIVKDLEVKNWFKIKKVLSGTGMIDVLRGNFILSDLKLEGIQFDLEKRKHGDQTQPTVDLGTVAGNVAQVQESFFLPQHIILKRLTISDGTFTFTDYTKSDTPIKITVKNLNMRIDNFQWPLIASEVTSFQLSGKIPWENIKEEGKVDLKGWINFYKKDMNAVIKIKDIDGISIHPYYSSWVDIDKARVEKARLDFNSNLTGLNNNVTASCHLEMTQLTFKPKEEQEKEPRLERITNVVVGLLKAMNQGKIVLDFNFKTKMDSPEFGLGIIQQALKDKLYQARKSQDSPAMQIIKLPGKLIGGTISTAADLTKSVINGTVVVGKELKKAMESSFSRESNSTAGTAVNSTAVNAAEPVNVTSSNTTGIINQTK